jgi:hypothetical protein
MGDLADEWPLPAMRAALGDRWDIRRTRHAEIVAVPRDGAGDPLIATSAAVLRVLLGEAEWARLMAKYRPSHGAADRQVRGHAGRAQEGLPASSG